MNHFGSTFILCLLGFLFIQAKGNVHETGTATVPATGFVYTPEEGGSGQNCVKYSVTLSGGVDDDIMAGVVTLADGSDFDSAIDSYSTVDEASNALRSKLVAGSECSFSDFGSNPTCSRVVGLSQSETYVAGVANGGDGSADFTYTISECTDAEAASVSSGITLNGLIGLTSAIIVALVLAQVMKSAFMLV